MFKQEGKPTQGHPKSRFAGGEGGGMTWREAFEKRNLAIEKAQREFSEATHDAWTEYSKAWQPLREEWERASKPHFDKLQVELARIEKEYLQDKELVGKVGL